MKTKQQVVALAEKLNIDVSFRYIPNSWETDTLSNFEICFDAPIGYCFSPATHCRVELRDQITKAYAKENKCKPYLAKDFWNEMMGVLDDCVEFCEPCDCEECIIVLKELHQQYKDNLYKVNREAVEK